MQTVVETPAYLRRAGRLQISEDELDTIKLLVAQQPDIGDVIPGSGGARKVRVRAKGKGKRGGYRIVTFYSGVALPVFLLDIYAKSEKTDLTRGQIKNLRIVTNSILNEFKE